MKRPNDSGSDTSWFSLKFNFSRLARFPNDSGSNDTWMFPPLYYYQYSPPDNAYQYFQTWCGDIALNPADTTHLTSYPIDIPNFSDSTVTGDNAAAFGYNTMNASDRHVQFEWQFREVDMKQPEADLWAVTNGAYICYMPMIHDKGYRFMGDQY